MLMRRWERARQGDGQFVMIVGEPGLGKSRLIEEFRLRLRETPHTWVEWAVRSFCKTPRFIRSRNGAGSALAAPMLRRSGALRTSRARCSRSNSTPRECAAFGALWLISRCRRTGVAMLAPEELRRRQLAALNSWMFAGARVQPVVLAFEDLHWADPTTIDVLRALPSAVHWRRFLSWQQHAPSSSRRGAHARITARFRWCRSTVIRCGIWWESSPPDMPCHRM